MEEIEEIEGNRALRCNNWMRMNPSTGLRIHVSKMLCLIDYFVKNIIQMGPKFCIT